jgi:hypothetical protein
MPALPCTVLLADIALHWLLLIFVVGGLVFLVLIARLYRGSGADLLDFPERSPDERIAAERDDLRGLIAVENARRRKAGKPEISEEEVLRDGIDALRRD